MTCRRSLRPNPQIHASEEGAGMAPRLHPRIQASEEAAGVIPRRSPRLHPQPAPAASLPDDMLREILLRLPTQPSSLPRASAVCKRWRGLVTDPKFHRQFRLHHRKPPLLGFFEHSNKGIVFSPILGHPGCIPPQRFNLGRCSSRYDYDLLDCRHGLVLVKNNSWTKVVVCDLVTSEQRRMAVPPEFRARFFNGSVLCTAGDQGHVHGGCHSSPFKVVLMSIYRGDNQPLACVYSSEDGAWGNVISTDAPHHLFYGGIPAILVGNALYALSISDGILEFDLDECSLTLIKGPPVAHVFQYSKFQIIQVEDGVVGLAILSYPHFRMWQRNVNSHGVATWVPWKTIEMHIVSGLPPQTQGQIGGEKIIRGYDEDTNVIFLHVDGSDYMVQLKSMQSRKLYETIDTHRYHPFKIFYTPGTSIAVESS